VNTRKFRLRNKLTFRVETPIQISMRRIAPVTRPTRRVLHYCKTRNGINPRNERDGEVRQPSFAVFVDRLGAGRAAFALDQVCDQKQCVSDNGQQIVHGSLLS
jgi:hypothetical protein